MAATLNFIAVSPARERRMAAEMAGLGAFVGVFVPPGRGIVRLRYRPKEFDHGVKAVAATLFVLGLVACIHAGLRKRRKPSAAEPAPAA